MHKYVPKALLPTSLRNQTPVTTARQCHHRSISCFQFVDSFLDANYTFPLRLLIHKFMINPIFSCSLALAPTTTPPSLPKAQMRLPMQFVTCTACLRNSKMDSQPQVHQFGFPPEHNGEYHTLAHLPAANYTNTHAHTLELKQLCEF